MSLLHNFTSINSAIDSEILTRQNNLFETLTGYCCVATVVDGETPSSFHSVRGRLTCKSGCLPPARGGKVPGLLASRCLMDARRAASVQASLSRTNDNRRARLRGSDGLCSFTSLSYPHELPTRSTPIGQGKNYYNTHAKWSSFVQLFFSSINFHGEETP